MHTINTNNRIIENSVLVKCSKRKRYDIYFAYAHQHMEIKPIKIIIIHIHTNKKVKQSIYPANIYTLTLHCIHTYIQIKLVFSYFFFFFFLYFSFDLYYGSIFLYLRCLFAIRYFIRKCVGFS